MVVGDRREKEMVFEVDGEMYVGDGEGKTLMRNVVDELSRAWKPFNRAFF